MYVPASFAETDRERLYAFLDEHSFAALVTAGAQAPFASHLPVLLDRERGVLLGHLARANPHWRSFDGADALVIFTGPHGYVSPAWYETTPAVPTWNFTAVHVYGPARAVTEEAALSDIVDRLARKYEGDPAWLRQLPPDFRRKMLQGIVGVEVAVGRVEGKFKLSQNKSRQDRLGVLANLERRGDEESRRLAAAMREQLERAPG
jgi:transcriptional regulator